MAFGVEDEELQVAIDAIGEAPMTFEDVLPHLTNHEEDYPELKISECQTEKYEDYGKEDEGYLEKVGVEIAKAIALEARTNGRRRGA